jgi:hypothetical protein
VPLPAIEIVEDRVKRFVGNFYGLAVAVGPLSSGYRTAAIEEGNPQEVFQFRVRSVT